MKNVGCPFVESLLLNLATTKLHKITEIIFKPSASDQHIAAYGSEMYIM